MFLILENTLATKIMTKRTENNYIFIKFKACQDMNSLYASFLLILNFFNNTCVNLSFLH